MPGALAGLLLALCLLALVPTPAAAQTGAPAPAAEPTSLPYTHDCGGDWRRPAPSARTSGVRSRSETGGQRQLRLRPRAAARRPASASTATSRSPAAPRALDEYAGYWEAWALDNQRRQLAAGEPLNWVGTVAAHNGYNNRADGYTRPEPELLADRPAARLGALARSRPLLAHSGATPAVPRGVLADGPPVYTSGIKEIGAWLDWTSQGRSS